MPAGNKPAKVSQVNRQLYPSPNGGPAETRDSLGVISICGGKASHHLMDLNESQRTAAEYGIGDDRPAAPFPIESLKRQL